MRGLAYAACAAVFALALPVHAAEVTRVMSSFDEDVPFGLDLQVGFERDQRRALIQRENHQDGQIKDVAEMRFTEIQQSMPIRLAIGLYHDLELHASMPIVFNDDRTWGYPGLDSNGQVVNDASSSTVQNNCIDARGNVRDPQCFSNGTGAKPIFPIPGGAYRGGVGNITVGLAWAILSEKRDDTKPTWVVGGDYTYPLADAIDPTLPTSQDKRGPMGDKVHRFTPYMAASKKVGFIDPYVKISATIPTLAPGYYSNCDHANVESYPENCGAGPWDRTTTGIKPPYVATAQFGAEFSAYDDPGKHQSVIFDLRGLGTWSSEGRSYNELSDATGKLLYTEQYMTVGGSFGLYARAAEYVQLKLNAAYYHDTDHMLTDENVGSNSASTVDLSNGGSGINPNYDFRYDTVGQRFRIAEVNVFTVMATGVVTF